MIALLPLLAVTAVSEQLQPMVQADPATCNTATASLVDLRYLLENWEGWYGRCVSVVGLWSGRTFYLEMRDARPRGESEDDSRDRRLGVYVPDQFVSLRGQRPRSFRATGVLLDCERLWEGQVFVSGYCHNNLEGPILVVTSVQPAR